MTPAHASWLNEAELLNEAFGLRYLKRQSWESREAFIEHLEASSPEYNRLHAHPFESTWTNHRMRQWFAHHTGWTRKFGAELRAKASVLRPLIRGRNGDTEHAKALPAAAGTVVSGRSVCGGQCVSLAQTGQVAIERATLYAGEHLGNLDAIVSRSAPACVSVDQWIAV